MKDYVAEYIIKNIDINDIDAIAATYTAKTVTENENKSDEFDLLDISAVGRSSHDLDDSEMFHPPIKPNFGFARTQSNRGSYEPDYIGKWNDLSDDDLARLAQTGGRAWMPFPLLMVNPKE